MSNTKKTALGGGKYFLLGYLVYCMVYVCRNGIAMVQKEMGFGEGEYSLLVFALLCAYAVGRLLNGWLGDILPCRIMIGGGIFVAGLCNLLVGLLYQTGIFPLLVVLWAVNGYAESMIWGSLLDGVYRRCGCRKSVAPLLVSSVGVGSILAVVLSQQLALHASVSLAFVIPGGISMLLGLLSFFFFGPVEEAAPAAAPTQEAQTAKPGATEEVAAESTPEMAQNAGAETPGAAPDASKRPSFSLKSLLRFDRIGIMLLPAVLHGIFKDNLNSYAPAFFSDAFGIELASLALFVFVIPLLTLAGRLLYPLLFRLFGERENTVSLVGFGLCGVSILFPLLGIGGAAGASVGLAVFAAAISLINTSLLSVFPLRFAEEGNVSSVTGVLDFVIYLSGALASLVYGALHSLGKGQYPVMFASWLVCCVAGAMVTALLAKKEWKKGARKDPAQEAPKG